MTLEINQHKYMNSMNRAFHIVLAIASCMGAVRASGDEDLILWWNFEEPEGSLFRDASGHDRDGTAFDVAPGQVVPQAQGKIGAAIQLQAERRNLVKSDLVNESAYPGGSFSLELWVKDLTSNAESDGALGAVIAMQRTGQFVAWSLGLRTDGTLRFFANAGGSPATHDTGPINWEAGVWYRIVLSCRAEDAIGHYRVECFKGDRAEFSEEFEAPAPRMEGAGSFLIGGDHASTSPDRILAGWVDEVRYFKSPKLPGAKSLTKTTKN
jgi:hypothetical protein